MSELAKRLGVTPTTTADNANDNAADTSVDKNVDEPTKDAPADAPENTNVQPDNADKTPENVVDEAAEDAKLLHRLNSRHNTNFQTLDELYAAINRPAEMVDEATAKKKKATEVLKYGLEAELVTTDDYNNYQVDHAKSHRQLVYEAFAAKHAGKNEAQINRLFAKKYGEDLVAEEDDDEETKEEIEAIKQERTEEMKREYNRILKKKYGHVLTLEEKYDNHVAQKKAEEQKKKELAAKRETYTADLSNIISATTKRPIHFGDKDKPETIFEDTFEYTKEILDQVKQEFLQQAQNDGFIENYNKATLQKMVDLRLEELTRDSVIEHASKKYYSKKVEQQKANRKNLVNEDVPNGASASGARSGLLAQRLVQMDYIKD